MTTIEQAAEQIITAIQTTLTNQTINLHEALIEKDQATTAYTNLCTTYEDLHKEHLTLQRSHNQLKQQLEQLLANTEPETPRDTTIATQLATLLDPTPTDTTNKN